LTSVVQQTVVEIGLPKKFTDYADREGKTVQDVYAEAVQSFIDSYQETPLPFLASPIQGETLVFRLDKDLKLKAQALCKGKSRARRLYYTAIHNYAKTIGLIQ